MHFIYKKIFLDGKSPVNNVKKVTLFTGLYFLKNNNALIFNKNVEIIKKNYCIFNIFCCIIRATNS